MASGGVAGRRAELVAELGQVRRAGITRLRSLDLPALGGVASAVLDSGEPAAVERLLRQGIAGLGGGHFGEAALLLFGLASGSRGRRPGELREAAARVLDVQPDTFRKTRERQIIEQLADQLVGLTVLQRVTPTKDEGPDARQARLERIASEIAALPAADLGPLVQLLRERLNNP